MRNSYAYFETAKKQVSNCGEWGLPKEPKNMDQGAITQDAHGQWPWRPAPGATSSSSQAWALGQSPNSQLNTSKPILYVHTVPHELVPKTTDSHFSDLERATLPPLWLLTLSYQDSAGKRIPSSSKPCHSEIPAQVFSQCLPQQPPPTLNSELHRGLWIDSGHVNLNGKTNKKPRHFYLC